MPRLPINFEGRSLLDISSYARRGPGRRDHLSSAEIELIARTVHRTPEVMVKVLTRGGQSLGAVQRHLEYLDRKGELEIDTDDGPKLAGRGVERELLDDWDLDMEEDRRRATLAARPDRRPPKLVHKVLFSMPPGTPPKRLLGAVKNFAREEFGLKHRYAMVLHIDEPHPHVHMIIKAMSEQGERLNIRKATLRGWRGEFARHLRQLGVPANATERAVRGERRSPKFDGLYRAEHRGESRRVQTEMNELAREAVIRSVPGKDALIHTRKEVERGWWAASKILAAQGESKLASEIRRFVDRMPPPKTDREVTAEELSKHRSARARKEPTR